MEIFLDPNTWIALLTLTILEIVLGIDNILFISIVANKLPVEQRGKARTTGLVLALGLRILLLFAITYIVKSATQPLFSIGEYHFSIRNLIMIGGGLFLIAKSTSEINHKMEGANAEEHDQPKKQVSVLSVIAQVILMDLIFSFDSILTAVGLTNNLPVMIMAVVISLIIMMAFSGKIGDFIARYPSMEMLALSFLILIGFTLVLDGLEHPVDKQFIYFSLFFSLVVEALNIRLRKKGGKAQK